MKLFKKESVKRVFDLLKTKGGEVDDKYTRLMRMSYCEKEIFLNRASKIFLPSNYVKLYNYKINKWKFIFIAKMEYHLGSSEEFDIWYIDYNNLEFGIQKVKVGFNEIIDYEGVFSNENEFNVLLKIISPTLPNKTYIFKAIKHRKNQAKITFVNIEAVTENEANFKLNNTEKPIGAYKLFEIKDK